MAEPRIQYAKTSDGVNIAYGEAGEGPPIVIVSPAGFNHASLNWETFPVIPGLAARHRTLWFDFRGAGLSDRSAADFSLIAAVQDIEAVVERSGIENFVLVAWGVALSPAVAYTVAHLERVSHLITCDGCSRFSDYADTAVYRSAMPLLEIDWQLYTETFGQVLWAFSNPEFGRRFGEVIRAAAEPDTHRALWKAWEDYDVSSLLPMLSMPTLVVQNKNNRMFTAAVSQRLAAAVPGARLATIDDITYSAVPEMVERFLEDTAAAAALPQSLPSGTAIILFADIVDSTPLTERLGDKAFREKARDLDASLRKIIREHSGSCIDAKTLGDGVLATFASAAKAIEAALACGKAGAEAGLPLHLGLHAGDVIREENNVYGGAVNIASRISGLSAPGEVLVSRTVADLARTSAGVTFEDRGEQKLKGIDDPVRVYQVRWRDG